MFSLLTTTQTLTTPPRKTAYYLDLAILLTTIAAKKVKIPASPKFTAQFPSQHPCRGLEQRDAAFSFVDQLHFHW